MAGKKGQKAGPSAFKPGPDSRRKKLPRLGTGIPPDLKEEFKRIAPEAIKTLERVMKGKQSAAAKVKAAEIVIERALGKMPQQVQATGEFHFILDPKEAPDGWNEK